MCELERAHRLDLRQPVRGGRLFFRRSQLQRRMGARDVVCERRRDPYTPPRCADRTSTKADAHHPSTVTTVESGVNNLRLSTRLLTIVWRMIAKGRAVQRFHEHR
jgi:hypothetical protein